MKPTVTQQEIDAIANSEHPDPFEVLGMHIVRHNGNIAVAVRAFCLDVRQCFVYVPAEDARYPMERVSNTGFFEAMFPDRQAIFSYQLETVDDQGNSMRFDDVYAFLPVLGEEDLYLFGEGKHDRIYEQLGCHLIRLKGVSGAVFAVWAPNAKRVSVIGDFNQWDGRKHPMRRRGASGIWELFIPGLQEGKLYKFEIKTTSNHLYNKTDPYGFACQSRPENASVIFDVTKPFPWDDGDWMRAREQKKPLNTPISVYEVHAGSWMRGDQNRFLTYRELAEKLIPYVKDLGFTHIEFLPIAEHPLDASWGYQTTGYYAPTSRFGRPEDLMFFVNACHREGIGVIVDWVPAHFPRDSHGLSYFDGTYLYEHADPRLGAHQDWGTLIFNYGRNEVRNFLIGNALFWFTYYHIDGIRVDAVTSMLYLDYSRKAGEWLPNKFGGNENLEAIDFLKELNQKIYAHFPGAMTIAEESASWPAVSQPTYVGGLGFLLKWNMGWMHDMLGYMATDPLYRKYQHHIIPSVLQYAFQEHFMLVLSHDDVVHGKRSLLDKMPGDAWQKFANLRILYGFMFGHPGKKLLFMGGEFGQWREWHENTSLDWNLLDDEHHRALQRYVRDLNWLYRSEPALFCHDDHWQSFVWIDARDSDYSVVSFLRKSLEREEDALVFVCNFTPLPRYGYRIGVPRSGYYRELLNSDATYYGGSGVGNCGGSMAEPTCWQNQPYSLNLTLPPLSVLVLKAVS